MEQIVITKQTVGSFRLQVCTELAEYAALCKLRESYSGDKSGKAYLSFVGRMEAADKRIRMLVNKLMAFYGYRNKCQAIQWFKTLGTKLVFRNGRAAKNNWLCLELAGGEKHVG